MKPSEASRPVTRRSAPHRGRRTVTAAHSGSMGEDILLARHGDHIIRLRQDARAGQTVATLRDGSSDAAPNHLDGGASHLSPADRTGRQLVALASDHHAESRRELRFLARLSVAWLLISAVALGAMVWFAATFMDPQDLQALMTGYLGYPPR
ncbi:hypothetical protein [Citricoccus zhacaiensis]|nr:hypothetical protein [Citricoccus zhacaiensis]